MNVLHLLKERGVKVSCLARFLGVSSTFVYRSIRGRGSRQARVFIACLLQIKPSSLWVKNNKVSLILDDAFYEHNLHKTLFNIDNENLFTD